MMSFLPPNRLPLYEQHPANVVRLILGREENKYDQAARLFREWLDSGILKADEEPSLYVYHQAFDDPATGKPAPDRIGLICLLKLEEYSTGRVLPHEKTLTGPKADRLELLKKTEAQFESIYGLYSDPDGSVQSFLREYDDRETVIERIDGMIGSSHRIERIADSNAHAVLRDLLADTPVFYRRRPSSLRDGPELPPRSPRGGRRSGGRHANPRRLYLNHADSI